MADDANEASDVFVRDREAGTTVRVSLAEDGSESRADSFAPAISRDGRYVAFLRAGAHGFDVWVHDRNDGTTRPVSRARDGSPQNGRALSGVVSNAPAFVVFESASGNLPAGAPDADASLFDVFAAADVPPVTSTTSTTTTTRATTTSTTSTAPPTTSPSTTTTTSAPPTTTTTQPPVTRCPAVPADRLVCLLSPTMAPPACAGVALPHAFGRRVRRAQAPAERATDQSKGRGRLLRRVRNRLDAAVRRLDRADVPAACRAAILDVIAAAQGIVNGLLGGSPRVGTAETSPKITPELAELLVTTPDQRIRVYVLLRNRRRADGTKIALADVTANADVPIIPGLSYLRSVAREVVVPLTQALREAECEEISGFSLAAPVYARCTPGVIRRVAERRAVELIGHADGVAG